MIAWHETESGTTRSADGRFVLYPIPEGWAAIDRADGILDLDDISDVYQTQEEAAEWCERRLAEVSV